MAALFLSFVVALGALGAFGVTEAFAQTAPAAPAQSPPAPSAATVQAPAVQSGVAPSDYRLGPQDVLKITVFGEPTLSGQVRVDSDGTIPFQYLQRVKAEGYTVAQVA